MSSSDAQELVPKTLVEQKKEAQAKEEGLYERVQRLEESVHQLQQQLGAEEAVVVTTNVAKGEQ